MQTHTRAPKHTERRRHVTAAAVSSLKGRAGPNSSREISPTKVRWCETNRLHGSPVAGISRKSKTIGEKLQKEREKSKGIQT